MQATLPGRRNRKINGMWLVPSRSLRIVCGVRHPPDSRHASPGLGCLLLKQRKSSLLWFSGFTWGRGSFLLWGRGGM